jgi:hypothetical protein
MKKIILLSAMIFSIIFTYSQGINLGVKVGYNSTLTLNDLHYNTQKFEHEFFGNMHFGGFFRFNFDKLYLQPELLYSMQRKDYDLTIVDNDIDMSAFNNLVKIKTIDVPVLLGYKLLDAKAVNLRAFVGPKFRFNTGLSDKIKDETVDGIVTDFKKAVLGFETGVGIDVFMFTLDVRYSYSGNLYETKWKDAKGIFEGISTSGLILTLGWKFL